MLDSVLSLSDKMSMLKSMTLVLINPCTYYYNPLLLNTNINVNISKNPNAIICYSSGRRTESYRYNFDEDNSKKRVWWSDKNYSEDFENEYNSDDDYSERGFAGLHDSFDTSLIFKVLNSFGWMVPAIGISMILGIGGTNTIVMALVLPLAQSAIRFIADTFLGSSFRGSKPKRKRARKKPFHRARNYTEMKQDVKTGEVNESHHFQETTKNKSHDKKALSFGGWDDLDRGPYKVPNMRPTRKANELRVDNSGKLSRGVRTRGTPLYVRLLIAVFPFLGSWIRLL